MPTDIVIPVYKLVTEVGTFEDVTIQDRRRATVKTARSTALEFKGQRIICAFSLVYQDDWEIRYWEFHTDILVLSDQNTIKSIVLDAWKTFAKENPDLLLKAELRHLARLIDEKKKKMKLARKRLKKEHEHLNQLNASLTHTVWELGSLPK